MDPPQLPRVLLSSLTCNTNACCPSMCRLVFYLCFNAFPSYDDVDSWEGTVKNLSSLCCMGGALGGSATVGGRWAARSCRALAPAPTHAGIQELPIRASECSRSCLARLHAASWAAHKGHLAKL